MGERIAPKWRELENLRGKTPLAMLFTVRPVSNGTLSSNVYGLRLPDWVIRVA